MAISKPELDINVDEERRVVTFTRTPRLAIAPVSIEVPFVALVQIVGLMLSRVGAGSPIIVAPPAPELPAQRIAGTSH